MKVFFLFLIAIVIGTVGGLVVASGKVPFFHVLFMEEEEFSTLNTEKSSKFSKGDASLSSKKTKQKQNSPYLTFEKNSSFHVESSHIFQWVIPPSRPLDTMGYVNSLGSFSNRKQAEDATIVMLFYYSKLFQNVRLQIMESKISLGVELFVGPFDTSQSAMNFCNDIKIYKYQCWMRVKGEQR